MVSLTAKQESFIRLMTEGEELERRGFELLLRHAGYDKFFDPLKDAGLFDADHNPAAVPAEEKGYVRIPYWSALDYLTAVAKLSGERDDLELANKVMTVVRSVASWRDAQGLPRENYHTAYKFAGIFGLVPTAVVTADDLGFIPLWLKDRFERMLVPNALDEGALPRFLASPFPQDWDKAIVILRHCTAIEWRSAKELGEKEQTPATVVDDFWMKRLIDRHSRAFGAKIGRKAAEVFLERVREVFGTEAKRLFSRIYRPTIEDHYQNHAWQGAENRSVEGLRDVLLSWCEHDANTAELFVKMLLSDEMEIVRRVGIYALDMQWPKLQHLYAAFLRPQLFDTAHLHELFKLLSSHFAELPDKDKAATIESIRQLTPPPRSGDPAISLKRIQHRWLSAIAGKGYEPADRWLAELRANPLVGELPEHPDFDSYIEGWVGPGATPYSVAELVGFATAHTIVQKLNAFREQNTWRGSTIDGLTSALEEAVRTSPVPFLELLPDFLGAKRRFQHSLVLGLKQAWEASDRAKDIDWNKGWEKIITFFEDLLGNPEFWEETAADDPRRDWVISAVADCLDAGTRNDDRSYATELLGRTQELIAALLKNGEAAEQPAEDAMMQALNSPKGRIVEALFSQALRICRSSDRVSGSHVAAWASIRPLFDAELDRCKNANYEFSTLSGNYLAQLNYMDPGWTKARVGDIFPAEYSSNCVCAVDGLAYSAFTRPIYSLLREAGVLDRGLRLDLKGRSARQKLLERIAAAYLWGDETLESDRVMHIFDFGKVEDLETLTRVFWMVRGEKLSEEQRQQIIRYWQRCIDWSRNCSEPPARLLSSLSMLACFLETADGPERELLQAVATHVHVGHNAYNFVDELARLVEKSPEGVTIVLGTMIEARVPDFDYKDQLKSLLRSLAQKGKRREAISYAERLRRLSGVQELYDSLTRANIPGE